MLSLYITILNISIPPRSLASSLEDDDVDESLKDDDVDKVLDRLTDCEDVASENRNTSERIESSWP